jgi:hypothetical protein
VLQTQLLQMSHTWLSLLVRLFFKTKHLDVLRQSMKAGNRQKEAESEQYQSVGQPHVNGRKVIRTWLDLVAQLKCSSIQTLIHL